MTQWKRCTCGMVKYGNYNWIKPKNVQSFCDNNDVYPPEPSTVKNAICPQCRAGSIFAGKRT